MPTSPRFSSTFRVRSDGFACAAALSFTAGFADAAGYLLADVFAANMTGNTVLVAISAARGEWLHAFMQITTVCSFFAGAIAGRTLWRLVRGRASLVFLAEAALLLAAAFSPHDKSTGLALVAAAMGMQAIAIPTFAGTAVSTVVVTNTIARFATIVADTWLQWTRSTWAGEPKAANAVLFSGTWFCYFLGAAVACAAMPDVPHPFAVCAACILLLSLLIGLQQPRRTAEGRPCCPVAGVKDIRRHL
jgi:uncharacterized membrane protein YoaK (UPF0700 family)